MLNGVISTAQKNWHDCQMNLVVMTTWDSSVAKPVTCCTANVQWLILMCIFTVSLTETCKNVITAYKNYFPLPHFILTLWVPFILYQLCTYYKYIAVFASVAAVAWVAGPGSARLQITLDAHGRGVNFMQLSRSREVHVTSCCIKMADGTKSLFAAGEETKLELDKPVSEGIWRVSRITTQFRLPLRSETKLVNNQWLLNERGWVRVFFAVCSCLERRY